MTDKRNELASNPYTGTDKRHTEDQPDECVCVSISLPHSREKSMMDPLHFLTSVRLL